MPEIIVSLPKQEVAREFLAQIKEELSPEAGETLEQFRIAQTNLTLSSQGSYKEVTELEEKRREAYKLARENGVPDVLIWATEGEIYAKHRPEEIKLFLSDLAEGGFNISDITFRQFVCLLAAFDYDFDQPISNFQASA